MWLPVHEMQESTAGKL